MDAALVPFVIIGLGGLGHIKVGKLNECEQPFLGLPTSSIREGPSLAAQLFEDNCPNVFRVVGAVLSELCLEPTFVLEFFKDAGEQPLQVGITERR